MLSSKPTGRPIRSANSTTFCARLHIIFQAVTCVEHEAEAVLVRTWLDATKVDWRAARDLLGRRFSDRWAARPPEAPTGSIRIIGPHPYGVTVIAWLVMKELTNSSSLTCHSSSGVLTKPLAHTGSDWNFMSLK
jgi:hypothetical protein